MFASCAGCYPTTLESDHKRLSKIVKFMHNLLSISLFPHSLLTPMLFFFYLFICLFWLWSFDNTAKKRKKDCTMHFTNR